MGGRFPLPAARPVLIVFLGPIRGAVAGMSLQEVPQIWKFLHCRVVREVFGIRRCPSCANQVDFYILQVGDRGLTEGILLEAQKAAVLLSRGFRAAQRRYSLQSVLEIRIKADWTV